MMFKNFFSTILLGLALSIGLFFGVGQPSIAAAPSSAFMVGVKLAAVAKVSPKGELEVDRFLTSMPSGYYTIANVEGLKKLLEDPQTVLVDVREPSEYRSGHIPNAINIPLRTLTHNLDKIVGDRPVVLYCSSGYRSAMGVMTLHLLGYENVQGFPPSFAGWQAAGEAIASK
ncbi:rhodanese-like domain-containing protein [Phormidesmis priestleyi ULC007]|uniref:Rhodanese-like domain-containing protein n=1 Tax=Phormidesmis priestleyi ULC007 TaxID=1920490 RepID=A0A2T1DIS4_9CYAN|nr:rhodanese-like domain-containing protein [Phormidesmis priestleyi]PSB20410.1 rhodanese-like domain-containing protein [Phormidesmis priestleyi ULC007]PZO52986.1 MAG: rhodanese-like domain-containing protein [Phormidesmis priestleyi]